jgi:hypothetical protein
VKGRKRHILVDTLGLLLTVVVTAASVQDRDGARSVLEVLRHQFTRVRLIWADGAYAGDLAAWLWALRPWRRVRLEIVKRPTEPLWGFLPNPPKRYIPEMIQWHKLRSDRDRATLKYSYMTEISGVYSS